MVNLASFAVGSSMLFDFEADAIERDGASLIDARG